MWIWVWLHVVLDHRVLNRQKAWVQSLAQTRTWIGSDDVVSRTLKTQINWKILRARWRGRGDGGKSYGKVYAWMGGMGNKHITPRWQVDGDWWTRVKHWMGCIVTMRCCGGMKLICLVGVLSPGRKTYDHRTMGLSYSVYWVVVGGRCQNKMG